MTIRSFFLGGLMLLSGLGFGQDKFEGRIEFELKYMGEMADQMAAFLPTAYNYDISQYGIKYEMEGGMMASTMGVVLLQSGKTQEMYLIKPDKAHKISDVSANESDGPTIAEADEEIMIMGYKCKKYIITTEDQTGAEHSVFVWVTDELEYARESGGLDNNAGLLFTEGIKGVILKTMTTTDVQGSSLTTTMTATKVEEIKYSKNDFTVPKDLEVVESTLQEAMGM